MAALTLAGCGSEGEPTFDLTNAAITHYRITSVQLPESTQQVIAYGFDLDGDLGGDGGNDNQLGSAHAALLVFDAYYQVEVPAAARLGGDVGWVLTIYDAGSRGAGVRVTRGVVVDGAALPVDDGEPAQGPGLDPADRLDGGDMLIPLGVLSDGLGTADPGWIDPLVTEAAVLSFDSTDAVVQLGVAIRSADLERIVIANLAAFYTDALANGLSVWARDEVDDNRDGVVTPAEIEGSLVAGFLSRDLIGLDEEAISLGLRITATALPP